MGDLTHHLADFHHAYLRDELPRIEDFLSQLGARHVNRHPQLRSLREIFAAFRDELTRSMIQEEEVLFPLIRGLESSEASVSLRRGLDSSRQLLPQHGNTAKILARMRALSEGFTAPEDADVEYHVLYGSLALLGNEIRRLLHEEDGMLFPRAISAATTRLEDTRWRRFGRWISPS